MIFKISDYEGLQTALGRLCEFLSAHDIPQERIFDCKLVACELLGNVLKHGDGKAALTGRVEDNFVELKIVTERSFILPEKITCSDLFSEGGRGLFLVSKLCQEILSETDGIRVRIKIEK